VPFLRVIRDKRGYETTYLMHWYREGSRQRSRILYVFRSPGGVRVGRVPLEQDVLRQIESAHPDIAFDWHVIRENQQIVEPSLEPRRRRPRREEGEPPPAEPPAPAPAPVAAPAQRAPEPPPREPAIPAAIQGTTSDEQMAFLSEWYVIVRDRIPKRTSDPARVEALTLLCERLNPAAWTDADQITAGLQEAAQALERLSRVFTRRRRKTRRRAPGASPPESAPPSSSGS
jgi:hypothetical protein